MDPRNNQFDEYSDRSGYYGTGAPRRHHSPGSGWLIFFTILLILFSAGSLFLKRYEVDLDTANGAMSFSIMRKDQAQEALPIEPETEQAEAEIPAPKNPDAAKPAIDTVTGSGAELEISRREPEPISTAPAGETAGVLSFQEIYRKMIPSVASIICSTPSGTGTGTGIVMTADGYIITNQHVVEGGMSIEVLLEDQSIYEATLVGADAISDLAVLKIEASGLTPAEFGDSDATQVGDIVVAIGDPLGIELRGTMTDGIISAINRDVTTDGRTLTLLQTNAQLNNGNSGGPLINAYGQVIGINTMKMGNYYSSSVEGIGFAIPIATAKPIVDELIEKGYVTGRPAIGIQGDSVPSYARVYYRFPDGVYIAYVYPGSDAHAKGLAEGDIITSINGTEIGSMDELNAVKNQFSAGDSVTLVIYRGGNYYEVDVVLMDQNETS